MFMMVDKTTKLNVKRKNNRRSGCPISIGLESFGDKWTLLLIRDLISGAKRFKDFETGMEGIPTNILASRLKTLEEKGIIEKSLYQERPKRYEYKMLQKGTFSKGNLTEEQISRTEFLMLLEGITPKKIQKRWNPS